MCVQTALGGSRVHWWWYSLLVAMETLLAVPDVGLFTELLHLSVDMLLNRSEVALDGAAPRGHADQGTAETHHHLLEATSELE